MGYRVFLDRLFVSDAGTRRLLITCPLAYVRALQTRQKLNGKIDERKDTGDNEGELHGS